MSIEKLNNHGSIIGEVKEGLNQYLESSPNQWFKLSAAFFRNGPYMKSRAEGMIESVKECLEKIKK